MKNNYDFNCFESSEELVKKLSLRIVDNINDAIKSRGEAVLAVSGGSTPKKLFQALSNMDIEWHKVTITLVDERWVNISDLNSNERLVKKFLLQNKAKRAKFISLKNVVVKAIDGVKITTNRLKKISKLDVVVLGMGLDAHTASFFPHVENLDEILSTDELCCATEASVEPKERMTLSKSFLLTANSLILHFEGESKREVFDLASQSSDVHEMPIISMMQQEKPILEVYYA